MHDSLVFCPITELSNLKDTLSSLKSKDSKCALLCIFTGKELILLCLA